jgi:hypothetical protein
MSMHPHEWDELGRAIPPWLLHSQGQGASEESLLSSADAASLPCELARFLWRRRVLRQQRCAAQPHHRALPRSTGRQVRSPRSAFRPGARRDRRCNPKSLGTNLAEFPCFLAAFEVNSESNTGARPSVRLCGSRASSLCSLPALSTDYRMIKYRAGLAYPSCNSRILAQPTAN